VKIDSDLPLDRACLVACCVITGWGAAVNQAGVRPGDDVVIVGVGGIGTAAVQGARVAGAGRIFAVDIVEFKRDQAKRFGATHVAESIDEVFGIIQAETRGRMCQKAVVSMGVGDGSLLGPIMSLVGKGGRVVWTNITPQSKMDAKISLLELTTSEKQLVGSLYGSTNARTAFPRLFQLYRQGQLDLDGMITRTYPLQEINQGYRDMREGRNIRGVIIYD
jgi:S-(hydroxymethyl)glutathione dehydrogenase/alcohol dehydrogenase